MPKRIFIGIRPDEQTIKNIKTFREEFSHLPVHWAREENIHVTLVPPWRPADFEKTLSTFQSLKIDGPAPGLTFTQIQLYRTKGIIWARGKAPDSLLTLIDKLTSTFNLPQQKRKYLMHITLAKHVDQTIGLPNIQITWQFVPTSLILFESLQSKTGTVYKTISEISFA